jgi:hypothetical protein
MVVNFQDANDILRARLARMLAITSMVERDLQSDKTVAGSERQREFVCAMHHDELLWAYAEVVDAVSAWRKMGGQE